MYLCKQEGSVSPKSKGGEGILIGFKLQKWQTSGQIIISPPLNSLAVQEILRKGKNLARNPPGRK
jgi:hypothetical protein